MQGTRQKKLARQIQRDLADIFAKEMRSTFDNAFITVTDVICTPDLSIARVYLSFMLVKNRQEMLEKIEENNKLIRQKLALRLKDTVRKIPELHFYYDDTADVQEQVNKLFENIVIPPKTPDEKL
ncbi:MAG: 30S ribosome-binding factor RbfA [Cytophagales bacterium]|nr:30S ribosome-binding factor RbfA [Cytophagales bacterium]MDW8384589.1 30S ribosome-binding factor RbfA [Flammeovirgaceae bacterium]